MRILLGVLLIPVLTGTALSQGRPAAAVAYGAVSGTVTCSDTNLPARITSVTLQPVPEPVATQAKVGDSRERHEAPAMFSIYRTHIDGSFQIPNVKPGRYYVVVQKPGYLSPVSQFNRDEISKPTPEITEAIAKAVPIVTVLPNATATVDVRLIRAASVEGVVLFDDGTPASEQSISFERRTKDGKFIETFLGNGNTTNDLGRYHVSGLPAGEYRMKTSLAVMDIKVDNVFGGPQSMLMNFSDSAVTVFYGDTFHRKDAKTFKIEDGQSLTADLVIPLQKLHTMTGSLVDARTGRVLNAGKIEIYSADDPSPIASASVGQTESVFHFEYLPEGEYTLRVKDAREVRRELVPKPAGTFGTDEFKETLIRQYGAYEAPLIVQGDRTGVALPIPAGASGSPAASPTD